MKEIRLKDCFINRGENLSENFSGEILYVDIGSVSYENGIINKELINFENAPSRARKIVKNNDIIISTVRTYLKSIVKIENPENNLIVSTGFSVLKSKKNYQPKFLEYSLKNDYLQNIISQKSKGVSYPSINNDELLSISIDCPNFEKQTVIADYLDKQTNKLNKEISLLKLKVEKLDEYKQALIYETVTNGLDKNVPIKDSEIEWIGMIPEHWELKRVKDLFDLKKGKNAGYYSKEYILDEINKGEYPVYSGQTENEGIMGTINTFEYDFPKGTLFTTTVGAKAMTVTKLFSKFSLSQNCGLLINKEKSNINWNYYMILNCFEFTKQNIPSHMQPSLRKEDLSSIFCFNIPYNEQQQIANYLDEECLKIDKEKELINKKIELLKEYKQALIYEAVTGKMDIKEEL